MFILFINNLYKFALLLQISNVIKLDIEIIYCCLDHLNIDNIIKLISIFTEIEIPNSISKFFYKTFVLAKQVKYILKDPAIRVLLPKKRIYISLVNPITFIVYNNFKYSLF